MNPQHEKERASGAQLEAQLSDLLILRERLGRERGELEQAGNSVEAGAMGRRIAQFNEEELPSLKKAVRDAANAAKDSRARAELKRLFKRIGHATSGIYTERITDISSAREAELQQLLAVAKTNSQRRKLAGQLEQLQHDRARIEKERDESAKQDDERRRQHRGKQERKRTERLLRKLGRTGPQKGTSMRRRSAQSPAIR